MSVESYIVRSKLLPPALSASSIGRPRLENLGRLSDLPKVVLVSAPAGYGKTTVLAQWHAQFAGASAAAAWVSLDEDDRDTDSFLSHVIVALADAGIDLGALETAAEIGLAGTKLKPALNGMLNALQESERDIVLFLDDYHRAFARDVCRLMEAIIERMPDHMHVILAGRGHPGIRISGLRSSGQIMELSQSDIRFTLDEARSYFADRSKNGAFARMHEELDGWPVGLHLLRMTENKGLKPIGPGTSFSNGMTELQDYWGEQVLQGLSDEYIRVLMDISILDRVNGDLLNSLCVRQDGWELLEDFERRDLFITPLDSERGWFQFHQLFRGYLLKRLERLVPDRIVELHRRAALWWMTAGGVRSAFRHAAALEKPDLIVEFLDLIGGFDFCLRGGTPALQIVGKLPEALAQANARLWLARIYYLAQTRRAPKARAEFRELEELTDSFVQDLDGRRDELLAVEGYTMDLLLCGYENILVKPDQISRKNEKLEAIDGFRPCMSGWLKEARSWHYHVAGDFHEAIRVGTDAAEICKNAEYLFPSIYSRIIVAMAILELCRVKKTRQELDRTLADSEALFGPHNNTTTMPRVALAQIAYWAGDFDKTEELLESLQDDLLEGEIWFICIASAYSIATALSRHRPGGGRLARQIESFVQSGNEMNPEWLKEMLVTYRLREATNAQRTRNVEALLKTPFFKDLLSGKAGEEEFGWRLWQPAMSALIRASIMLGDLDRAKAALDRFEESVANSQHLLAQLKLKLLWAIYRCAAQENRIAAGLLRDALDMVSPDDFQQLFMDDASLLGPAAAILLNESPDGLNPEQRDLLSHMARVNPGAGYTGDSQGVSAFVPVPLNGDENPLSNRETTVLHLIWNGLSTKEISRKLELAEGTVKIYRKRLYAKLNAHSRAEAIAEGRRLGILTDPAGESGQWLGAAGAVL